MKVYILTPNPFPIGNVATNRFSTYATSLAHIGHDVNVLVLKGTETTPDRITARKGRLSGVSYEYMSRSPLWDVSAPKYIKAYLYIKGIAIAARRVAQDKPDVIILYTNDIVYIYAFKLLSRLLKKKIFIDKSEFPVTRKSKFKAIRFLGDYAFRGLDGIIVMTEELAKFYATVTDKKTRIFLLPMTVDSKRFDVQEALEKETYIGCVFGVHNRDCIGDTIKAFNEFDRDRKYGPVFLYLAGDLEGLYAATSELKTLELGNKKEFIRFLGAIKHSEMPSFLKNATCLVSTPRRYSSGGFPTKLGEYLASGTPVIITKVGEIGNYLTDKDCFFAASGDVTSIAEMMEKVFSDLPNSIVIGANGKNVAEKRFSADSYVEELANFLAE
jgi:glycosyltransferase involved in cell wall biosynthesis